MRAAARGDDAVLIGSHLDSVLDGGAYDGPLGVVSSLAAIDVLRDRGVVPRRPVVVGAFAEEEGSRFGIACLGSRLAAGTLSAEAATALRDRDGVPLTEAMVAAGLEPALGPAAWLARIGCFLELHVEQGRDLVDRDAAVGLASEIWPHGRFRFDFTGEANHAGTTRMEDRRDPMLAYAITALAAAEQARQHRSPGHLRSAGRRAQRHQRGPVAGHRVAGRALRHRPGADRAGRGRRAGRACPGRRGGTDVTVTPESVSGAVSFDPDLTARLAEGLAGRWAARAGCRCIPTQAGHDAGVLAAAGRADRDAVRPQPDRGLALPGRARRDRRLPGRRRGARRRARGAGPVSTLDLPHALLPDGTVRPAYASRWRTA